MLRVVEAKLDASEVDRRWVTLNDVESVVEEQVGEREIEVQLTKKLGPE